MKTLGDLDLTPRGETIVNLHGEGTVAEWRPWGPGSTCFADWTPEKGAIAKREAEEAKRVAKKMTAKALKALLLAWRVPVFAGDKKRDLVIRACGYVHARRYPKRFVNAAEPTYVCGTCKVEMGIIFSRADSGVPGHKAGVLPCCPACGAPSFALNLLAKAVNYAWYRAKTG